MNHKLSIYIDEKLKQKSLKDKDLVLSSKLSKGRISTLKNKYQGKITPMALYSIVIGLDDNIKNASKIIYPNLKLKVYKPKERNKFGTLMRNYETVINSLEEISGKTGIEETRLSEIYYRNGAPEAWELLLIEMAVGEQPGALFEKLYGEEFRKKVVEGIKEDDNTSKK